jgi:hypothetical protein
MPMRARVHGVVALLLLSVIAAACGAADASGRHGAPAPSTTTIASTPAHHHGGHEGHATAGGPVGDTAGDDAGALAHHEHDAALPPLATRLTDATAAERAAVADLLARTRATLAPFASEPAARATGFTPNDPTKHLIHYRNITNRRDGRALDPEHPEGLVYLRRPDGSLGLLGAVFTVLPGMPAPTPGGAVFLWHTHASSCGAFLVPAGACTDTFRMLHIWTASAAVDPWIQNPKLAFGRT